MLAKAFWLIVSFQPYHINMEQITFNQLYKCNWEKVTTDYFDPNSGLNSHTFAHLLVVMESF